MYRTIFFSLALIVSSVTIAEAKSTYSVDKVWTDADGVTHIKQAKPGIINLCKNGDAAMDVTANRTELTVKNGHVCRPDETPKLVLDTSPSHCGMVSGSNDGTVIQNCF